MINAGLVCMMLGVGAADSDKLWIPAVLVIIGALLVYMGKDEY